MAIIFGLVREGCMGRYSSDDVDSDNEVWNSADIVEAGGSDANGDGKVDDGTHANGGNSRLSG